MFKVEHYSGNKAKDYELMLKQLEALVQGEQDIIANLSNASALLNQFLNDVNWVGFYLWKEKDQELVLGPFQGLPACIRIKSGKGVCGAAIKEGKTQRVEDVNKFPGHIACDAASQSEIVVPLFVNDTLFGVLDIDSPITNRFDDVDQVYIEKFAETLQQHLLLKTE
ncbi:GAF domain-containing protein [Aquibacillus sp. 3ASR75-11]|uniref:GAF domain-containing protein n=1 Tax=Terrihalobacillus insolitus TaxID=2950438 RepID=A0A9X3WU68_9BACI|nr:GAF domain-containing protein [Terrihalobacillus insolitus]MDC3412671.1 GAF domain-containing protein [Terrihalobacillus insolitus]MDC3424021.1 GAF domain-containing protein [Terrihalobacillus insolitus]